MTTTKQVIAESEKMLDTILSPIKEEMWFDSAKNDILSLITSKLDERTRECIEIAQKKKVKVSECEHRTDRDSCDSDCASQAADLTWNNAFDDLIATLKSTYL